MSTVLAGSHIPLLVKLMPELKWGRPILEMGIGYNSTPLLHWMCKEKGVNLLSLEDDLDWFNKLKGFEDDHHSMMHVKDWDMHHIETEYWGLVFIDHKPARKRRSSARKVANCADFVVLHDSELADHPAYKYTPIYNEFKYKFEYKSAGVPHTMVLSNFNNLEFLK